MCLSRVLDQNDASQACYIVETYHSGLEPLICSLSLSLSLYLPYTTQVSDNDSILIIIGTCSSKPAKGQFSTKLKFLHLVCSKGKKKCFQTLIQWTIVLCQVFLQQASDHSVLLVNSSNNSSVFLGHSPSTHQGLQLLLVNEVVLCDEVVKVFVACVDVCLL